MAGESGMKHFDRQFVAVHLKKLLGCPNCHGDFALKSTNGDENHRPFLLPCGHNLCENCLVNCFESGLNLQCAVCSEPALPTINAQDLTSSSGLPYQLDYHVMGELAELENIRRSSTEHLRQVVVNNNAVTTHKIDVSPPALKSKCCECISSVATRECKQCSALYCKGCFETVHHNSRVLKAHAFKSLKDCAVDTRKRIRVGNDEFLMPYQTSCKIHQIACNIYCRLCKMTVCRKCVDRHHVGHQVQPLADINLRFVPDIPACKSTLDSALRNIHNGQAVVRAANAKQSGYAVEVLGSITQRYGQLHGLLQMSELKLTEQLRESSQPGQMELKKAMDMLNGYEAVIKQLQQFLEKDTTPVSPAPKDFWLKELLRLTSENLEKMPSSVKVSKVDGNPYRYLQCSVFSVPKNIYSTLVHIFSACPAVAWSCTMIEKHFECDYIDPRIVVRFRSELERNSSSVSSANGANSFFQTSSSGKENMYQQQAVIHPRMRAERSDPNPNANSQNQNQKRRPMINYRAAPAQDNELERTFSAMDISTNLNESKGNTNANTTRPTDWFKSNAEVSVLAIKSPEDFYVQGVEAAKQLRTELDSYVLTPSSTPVDIVVGQHYIAYHKDEDRFHRVLVSQKLTEIPDTYDVFLPDIGLNLMVHSSNFHELPYRLTLFPYAAVHCSLSDLKPRLAMWDTRASTHFKMVLNKHPVHVIVKRALSHQHHEVDLITTNYKADISVREAFLYAGLARARGGSAAELEQLMAPKAQRIPKTKQQIGDVLMIQMLHVNHPQEFYVMRHDLERKRAELEDSLRRTMDCMDLDNLENIFVGRLQMGCVMQLEDRWVRVCIEMLLKDGYVIVRLVDFGSTQKVSWAQLFVLPKEEREQRELSIKCCLADVETLQANDYLWTPEAIAAFKQLTSNPKMHMEVISVHEDVYRVTLDVIRSSSESLSVGVQMVALEHCASNGESSQQADVAPVNVMPLDVDTRKFIELQKDSVPLSPLLPDKQRKKHVHVELLHVRHPDEFYVTLPSFKSSIQKLQEDVQADAADRYQNNPIKFDWKERDMCYVQVRAQGDLAALWHRGVVLHVNQPTNENDLPRYEVQLRDLGELVRDVENVSLATVSEEQQHIAASAQRCQLYGLRPKNEQWTADNIDFFKDQLQAYDQLYSVSHGRHGQTMSVVLYGSHTVVTGPFTPSRTKFVNINETLVLARVAEKDPEEDYQIDKDPMLDDETNKSSEELAAQSLMNESEYLKTFEPKLLKIKPAFEHCEGMPPMQLLMDFGTSSPTTGQVKPPPGWMTPRPCKKSLYTGIVTNVNYDCDPYMSLASDKPFTEHMRDLLKKRFKPMMERRGPTTTTYVVGQPVLVTYHLDNELYRGIVQGHKSAGGYSVLYVDYGNIETVLAEELLPYAPFPQLNALCWLVTIHGVRPKRGKYTLIEMDTVHKKIVTQVCSVSVKEHCGPKQIPSCQIKVDSVDVATMMLHIGMAVPVDSRVKEKGISMPTPTLDAFKVFDELETLAAGGPIMSAKTRPERRVNDETHSTAQSPPVKKKYNVKHTNVQGFEFDRDIDCRQAADERQPINIGTHFDNFDVEYGDGMSMDPSRPQDADSTVSMEFENADIDEGIDNEDDENGDDDKETCTEEKPEFGVCKDQLFRRIQLRYKTMKNNASFAPLDTSTVRSLYGGQGSFKSHILPAGVKEFQCTIDCLISATELQISPSLCEFTKRDISLVQETSALINKAAPLHPLLDALCLARYSKDELWYRATVKEIHKPTKQATVYYIDFHDTETVSYAHLKEMPEELFMFPLRSCRVKLHGVKRNQKFGEKTVYQALQACLCNYPEVFARVHYPSNYHASKCDRSEAVFDSSSESIRDGHKLIEVELFENKNSTKRLYEPLIENWMFLKK
ncbi:LOW QUALITY PROTEIN: uncharacterized protein LOC111066827 [Drosophila obscura]|uniref:LOW QUALITY PROTEIN: uncharacterized protein LOC111066827 n=1 Tax=Drosophila obscura TaxID=7282 RepID=UPI001BB0DDB1|nr:LOW QUALITY PROTEIN: uncharacterized protein LOC111066827 [Drosophila obscura]